jgi:hypothetical protein
MKRPGKELTQSELDHIQMQLDTVRHIVRHCADERMPQGPCRFCLELYRTTINNAIDLGLYE